MGTKEKVKQATIGRATITDEPAPAAPAPKPTAIDFTGKVKKENYPQVLMVCRKGQDQKTAGQRCQGKMAYRMSPEGSRSPSFKCVSCGFTWTVPLGGTFSGA